MEKITFIKSNKETYAAAMGIDELRAVDIEAHMKKCDYRLAELTKKNGYIDSLQVIEQYISIAENEAELVFLALQAGMNIKEKQLRDRVMEGPFAKFAKAIEKKFANS